MDRLSISDRGISYGDKKPNVEILVDGKTAFASFGDSDFVTNMDDLEKIQVFLNDFMEKRHEGVDGKYVPKNIYDRPMGEKI